MQRAYVSIRLWGGLTDTTRKVETNELGKGDPEKRKTSKSKIGTVSVLPAEATRRDASDIKEKLRTSCSGCRPTSSWRHHRRSSWRRASWCLSGGRRLCQPSGEGIGEDTRRREGRRDAITGGGARRGPTRRLLAARRAIHPQDDAGWIAIARAFAPSASPAPRRTLNGQPVLHLIASTVRSRGRVGRDADLRRRR